MDELPQEAIAAIDAINTEAESNVPDSALDASAVDGESQGAVVADDHSGQTNELETQMDESLAERARLFGLDPGKYSPEDLQGRLDDFDRMLTARGRHAIQQQQAWQQQASQPAQQRPPQPQQQTPSGSGGQPLFQQEWKFGLPDDYDELGNQLDSGLQKFADYFHGHLNMIANVLLQQQQATQQWQQQQWQQAQERGAADFHDALQTLGDDMFGAKKYAELKPDSSEATAQAKLGDAVNVLARGYAEAGMPVPPLKQLVSQAYRVAFPERLATQQRRQFADSARQHSRSRLGTGSRVSARNGSSVPKTDDLVDDPVLKQWWADNVSQF